MEREIYVRRADGKHSLARLSARYLWGDKGSDGLRTVDLIQQSAVPDRTANLSLEFADGRQTH
jgi:hypothetical protein